MIVYGIAQNIHGRLFRRRGAVIDAGRSLYGLVNYSTWRSGSASVRCV